MKLVQIFAWQFSFIWVFNHPWANWEPFAACFGSNSYFEKSLKFSYFWLLNSEKMWSYTSYYYYYIDLSNEIKICSFFCWKDVELYIYVTHILISPMRSRTGKQLMRSTLYSWIFPQYCQEPEQSANFKWQICWLLRFLTVLREYPGIQCWPH